MDLGFETGGACLEVGRSAARRSERRRRKIGAVLKAKYAWKWQVQEQAARALEPRDRDAEDPHERKVEKLRAKIGQMTVEQDV